MKDNKSNKPGSWDDDDQSLSPVSDLIDVTDKALDKMYKNASQIFNNYSDIWADSLEDTISSSVPTFFRDQAGSFFNKAFNPDGSSNSNDSNESNDKFWNANHWPRWGGFRRRQLDSNVFQVEGPSLPANNTKDDSNGQLIKAGTSGNVKTIALDENKPKDLYAFPVPSSSQYEKCKGLDGTSLWTREGIWRCLFPASRSDQNTLDSALDRSRAHKHDFYTPNSSSSSANEDLLKNAQVFPDISTYLDWKSGVRTAFRKNYANSREQWKSKLSALADKAGGAVSGVVGSGNSKDLQNSSGPRIISEDEAKKEKKQVVSSSYASTTTTKEDGTLETKEIIKKWYSDGTASITENTKTDDNSKGWFWK